MDSFKHKQKQKIKLIFFRQDTFFLLI